MAVRGAFVAAAATNGGNLMIITVVIVISPNLKACKSLGEATVEISFVHVSVCVFLFS